MARLLHDYIGRYEPLRYPLPPLNQSSYTIFSFHRLAGSPPLGQSFFCGQGPGALPGRSVFCSRGLASGPHQHYLPCEYVWRLNRGPGLTGRVGLKQRHEAVQPRVSTKSPHIFRNRGSGYEKMKIMKIMLSLVMALGFSLVNLTAGFGAEAIKLPAPATKGAVSVEEALQNRRSTRISPTAPWSWRKSPNCCGPRTASTIPRARGPRLRAGPPIPSTSTWWWGSGA